MGKELRRYQNRMTTCGIGIIGFGFWAMVRSTAAFMTADTALFADFVDAGITITQIHIIGIILMFIIFSIMMTLYGFIGLRAIAIGKGKKPGIFYLIISFLVFLFNLSDVYSTSKEMIEKYSNISSGPTIANFDVNIAGLVVNITSALIMAELIISIFKVRKLMISENQVGGAA